MASLMHLRGLARLATRNVPRITMVPRQNVAVASMIRQYHAFRPSSTAWKKKRMVIDEDDEELAAELAELEREKQEAQGLATSQSSASESTIDGANSEEAYQKLRDTILQKTRQDAAVHEYPRHTALHHLVRMVQTPEQAQELPTVVAQWRSKQLPLSVLLSNRIIKTCVAQGHPEISLEMLGNREKYGLQPGQSAFRKVCTAFAKSVTPGAGAEESGESNESLEKLDSAFKLLALIPHYDSLMAGDAGLYAPLIRGSLVYGGEEGFRRAHVTFEEYSLVDAERAQDEELPSSIASQLVGAAKELQKAYESRPDYSNNAKKAGELINAWSKYIKA
ncbi:hypothetical protein DFQ26_007461 [Actinomortierella ambigua]|nr:hypothetical protein DFQ26_007461 [Actinomortierella ambigua]